MSKESSKYDCSDLSLDVCQFVDNYARETDKKIKALRKEGMGCKNKKMANRLFEHSNQLENAKRILFGFFYKATIEISD